MQKGQKRLLASQYRTSERDTNSLKSSSFVQKQGGASPQEDAV